MFCFFLVVKLRFFLLTLFVYLISEAEKVEEVPARHPKAFVLVSADVAMQVDVGGFISYF